MLKTTKLLLLAAALLVAGPALAAPVNYNFDNGNIQVQAFTSLTSQLVFDQTLDLKNTSFMVFDPTAPAALFGTGVLVDFLLEIEENQGAFSLASPFGPFDMVTVESAIIQPAVNYATQVTSPAGPNTFSVNAGPIDISAFYGASNSGGSPPPVTNVPANITGVQNLVGTITLLSGGVQLSLTGVSGGTVAGAPFGESEDLVLSMDVTFFGSEGAPIPEPGTGSLLGLGLAGLAARRRSARKA